MMKIQRNKFLGQNPTRMIILGFLIVIFMGTILLNLPIASRSGESIGFLDALFMATSAVCVTGLVVVNTLSHWSVFGKVVIICLIQIGGLGFMTFITLGLMLARKKITLKERILIKESYNQNSLQGMVKYVRRILVGTVFIELVGAIILSIRFSFDFGVQKGVIYGVFHSISAFCNAGFDIIGQESITPYVGDTVINLTIMGLIIIGGLGFTVWIDTVKILKMKMENGISWRNAIRRLSLHGKIVYTTTAVLIFGSALFFLLCEFENTETMAQLPMGSKVLASFMQAVTARTAGFNTIDQGSMTDASKIMTVLLMFIGGSPGGTAGGIKTVTMSVLVIAVISVIKGSRTTHCYERRIPFETLQKSLAVFFISLSAVIGITMLLTFTESGMTGAHEFMDLLFEVTSALGTVGVTTGVTPHLSVAGKMIIALAMFMGRIGPISIVIALSRKQSQDIDHIQYPEDRVIVG